MKNSFSEYNPKSKDEIENLWKKAIFIFDSNILLNLYRYSEETSTQFIQIISELNNRVWLPFQVGLEFNRNRLTVISDQKKNYTVFEKKLNDLIEEVENKNRNPFFSKSLLEKLSIVKDEVKSEIEAKIKVYDDSITSDSILEKINLTFENKVGVNFSEEEIIKIHKDGEKRFKNRMPPGYCDSKKPENEKYGDLILWKQIIQKSKDSKVDVLFISDDRKEDWWLDHQGKTISPRPELIKEFRTETSKDIYFYKPFQFLEYSNEFLNSEIKEDIIEEVKSYKPDLFKNDNFIQLNLTLQGSIEDFNALFNEMKNTGYNILKESNSVNDFHYLNIFLPNIPDLERRLNSKYISKLSNYNLNLIDIKKS